MSDRIVSSDNFHHLNPILADHSLQYGESRRQKLPELCRVSAATLINGLLASESFRFIISESLLLILCLFTLFSNFVL